MKRIYLLFFYLLISGYFLQAQELDPYQYFPTNVGDRWEYTQNGPDIVYTVIRDSIDQTDSSRFIYYNYNPMSAQYKINKDYNVIKFPQSANPWHVYKLNAKVGESWLAISGLWVVKLMDISQAYVFSKQTTVMTFGFYRPAQASDTVVTEGAYLVYWQKLAYGFGMISEEDGASQPTILRGCKINGVVFGTVDVKKILNELPSDFTLYQNYPNPFNPTTKISFSSPQKSQIKLKVFDVLGREVANLADGVYEVGKYEVTFDASRLPSGVYFNNLSTGSNTISKKMLLVK